MHLKTERLILRPFEDTDASVIFPLINEADVVRYLLAVPHPHPEDRLLPWMRSAREATRRRERFHFAIVLRDDQVVVEGCVEDIDAFQACGGDPTGRWKFQDACLQMPLGGGGGAALVGPPLSG